MIEDALFSPVIFPMWVGMLCLLIGYAWGRFVSPDYLDDEYTPVDTLTRVNMLNSAIETNKKEARFKLKK